MQSQPPRTPEPQNCIPYRTRECSQDGLWVLLVTACTQHETTPVKDCITTNGPNYRCVEGECVEQQQPPPPPQARCTSDGDCITDYCKAGVCAQPINYENCHDQRKNGGESDIDCGQVCPTKCDLEEFCLTAADCVTNYCNFGLCEERQQPEPENGICGTYRIGPPELLELSEGCNRDYLYDIPWGEFYMEIDSRNVRAWINEADGLHQEGRREGDHIEFEGTQRYNGISLLHDCTVDRRIRFSGTLRDNTLSGVLRVWMSNGVGEDCVFADNINNCEQTASITAGRIDDTCR